MDATNGVRAFGRAVAVAAVLVAEAAQAQTLIGLPRLPPDTRSAQEAAPVDFTGYWSSYITEDYRYRMFTPPRGDYASIVLTAEGRALADTWDPERDAAEGRACLAYGVGNIMRLPVRLRIEWADENTLAIETDRGRQRRELRFGAVRPAPGERTLQGDSLARWERRSLAVETRNMSASYIRSNGVPLGENAVVTEYFTLRTHPDGEVWFTVTTVVDDPDHLYRPYYTTSDFRRLDNGEEQWNPSPCVSEWGPLRERLNRPDVELILDRFE